MKTKQLLIVAITMIALTTQGFAQIKNIYLTKDSSMVMNNLYAGILSGTKFSIDSVYSTNLANVRLGSQVTYKMNKVLSVSTWAIYQIDEKPFSATSFAVRIDPIKNWNVQIGKIATLATEQRPFPVTNSGQFETWTQAQAPNGAIGVKTSYAFSKNVMFGTGVFERQQQPEYQADLSIKSFRIAGIYTKYADQFAVVSSLSLDRFYTIIVWKQNEVLANTSCVTLGHDKDIQIYSDQGIDLQENKYVRGEIGILKLFNSQWIKGKIGLGYNLKTRTVNGYLFVHL